MFKCLDIVIVLESTLKLSCNCCNSTLSSLSGSFFWWRSSDSSAFTSLSMMCCILHISCLLLLLESVISTITVLLNLSVYWFQWAVPLQWLTSKTTVSVIILQQNHISKCHFWSFPKSLFYVMMFFQIQEVNFLQQWQKLLNWECIFVVYTCKSDSWVLITS